ncbi:MAG: hypothetical protein RIG67_04225 [Rhodospirillales bacterium]
MNASLGVEDAVRADQDTENVPGNPSIADTIMAKIDGCAVFIPDISIVTRTESGRAMSNPNVLIEYGRATGTLGDLRIVPVFNEAYGDWQSDRPFDMQHKRKPITYNLHKDDDAEKRKSERDDLVVQLERAIKSVLENVQEPNSTNDQYLPVNPKAVEELRGEYKKLIPSNGVPGRMTGFWIGAIVANGPIRINRPFDHSELFLRLPNIHAWLGSGARSPLVLDTMDSLNDGKPSTKQVTPGLNGSTRTWERYGNNVTPKITGYDISSVRVGRDGSLLFVAKSNFHNPFPHIYAQWIMVDLANVYLQLVDLRRLIGRQDLAHELFVELRYDEHPDNIASGKSIQPVDSGEWKFGNLQDEWPHASKVMSSEPLTLGPFLVTANTTLTELLKAVLDEIYMAANKRPMEGVEFEIIEGLPRV